jgi:hypothetical protein
MGIVTGTGFRGRRRDHPPRGVAFLLLLFGGRLEDLSERWWRNVPGGPDE